MERLQGRAGFSIEAVYGGFFPLARKFKPWHEPSRE
jgi:hypothetical protein